MTLFLPLLIGLLGQTAPAQPPPRGVNDSILGTADQFKVEGSARICMNESGIDLLVGETSYLDYMGIHSASVRIRRGSTGVKISESEIWSTPERRGTMLAGYATPVYRIGNRYAIFGRVSGYDNDKDRLLLWVDNAGRPRKAAGILHRIVANVTDKKTCKRRFLYGWFFDDDDSGQQDKK